MLPIIISVMAGLNIGLVIGLIIRIFEKNKYNYKQSSGKSHGGFDKDLAFREMKQELQRVQAEIDALKTQIPPTSRRSKSCKKCCHTISTGCEYKSACDELDIADFDLLNEWHRTDCENTENALEYQMKLTSIDKKLDSGDKKEINNALEELVDLCFNSPEDVELLYRIGKAHVGLTEDQPEYVVKKHVEKGIEALSTALSLNDRHGDVQKWYAIALGLRSQFQPLREKARDGMLFKKHCELACVLMPDDPVLYYLLGRFDYETAGLGWLEKKVAATVMGVSLDSTYSDALNKFMTAERLSSRKPFSAKENVENKRMIANTLVAMTKKTEAEKWFRQVEALERLYEHLVEYHSLIFNYLLA